MTQPLLEMLQHILPSIGAQPLSLASYPQLVRLAEILQMPVVEAANFKLDRRYHYRPFSIPKRNGGQRQILAPSPALKELQRKLLRNYLQKLAPPAFVIAPATAFVHGASTLRNAQQHAGQKWIATVDIADFFGSISADRVRAYFLRKGWRGPALRVLMRLCVYRGSLPQGAPTSPALSNLVNEDLDWALMHLADKASARYTRYGDDLTFSWSAAVVPSNFERTVTSVLNFHGYTVQPNKAWCLYPRLAEPQVTGLVLGRDGRVRVPSKIRRCARWLRLCALFKRSDDNLRAQIEGYASYIRHIEG
jgi:hypothetical protein